MAVLSSPVLSTSVPAPTPVLKPPLVSVKSEYQPTAVLATPGGEVFQRVLPFRGGEVGIAAVRRRDNRLHIWQKPNADNPDQNVN